jgi:hypothetical protein
MSRSTISAFELSTLFPNQAAADRPDKPRLSVSVVESRHRSSLLHLGR